MLTQVRCADYAIFSRYTNTTDNINDGINFGPLSIFNERGNAIVVVPLDNFMSASMWHEGKPGGHLGWGIMGGVNEIPADFKFTVGIFYSDSINGVSSRLCYLYRDLLETRTRYIH